MKAVIGLHRVSIFVTLSDAEISRRGRGQSPCRPEEHCAGTEAGTYQFPRGVFRNLTLSLMFAVMMGMLSLLTVAAASASEKQSVGWIERAAIFPGGFVLPAKMDTGADNSSLNVTDFTLDHRDGQEWVRFTVLDSDGKPHAFERTLVRIARIKRSDATGQERPVVVLGICVGKYFRKVEVNLVDRRKYKYPLLIGRSFMSGSMTVDPSKRYSVEPECRGAPVE